MKLFSFFVFMLVYTFISYSQTGYISIESTPSDASIYIDGKFVGATPIDLYELTTGNHSLQLYYQNFESHNSSFIIKSNEIEKKTIILRASTGFKIKKSTVGETDQAQGKLSIITTPSDASILIDGTEVGEKSPITIEELGAGSHEITLKNYINEPLNDNFEITLDIKIRPNKTELLKVDFMDYLKVGNLILRSNLNNQQIELVNLLIETKFNLKTKNRSFSQKFTRPTETKYENIDFYSYEKQILNGSYQLSWSDGNKKNDINFDIFPEKTTTVFIPFSKMKLDYKKVADHHQFVTEEKYITEHINRLPEFQKESYSSWEWNYPMTLSTISFATSLVFYVGIDSEQELIGTFYGSFFGGIFLIWGIIDGFETKYENVRIKSNIDANIIQKGALKKAYKNLFKIWEKEIDTENKIIKIQNNKIETDNFNLPEAYVEYN